MTPEDERVRSVQSDPSPYQRALDEYREASLNFRLYADLRFKQLTLYTSIVAALLIAYARAESVALRAAIPWCGVLATVVFFVLEARVTTYRRGYTKCALALEPALGFRQLQATKLCRFWSSLWTIGVLFVGVLALWTYLLVANETGAGVKSAPSTVTPAASGAPANGP